MDSLVLWILFFSIPQSLISVTKGYRNVTLAVSFSDVLSEKKWATNVQVFFK
jgi:hypothetical protein